MAGKAPKPDPNGVPVTDQPPPPGHAAAGKFAQLLGETIVHQAPWTADIDNEAKWRHTKAFMDEMETHTAGQVGPFLKKLLDYADWPPELKPFLEEAIDPPAAFSAILEQIFLFGIVNNVISTSIAPFVQEVSNQLYKAAVGTGIVRPVDASVIATAVGRGLNFGDPPTVTVPDWAYDQAAQQGIGADDINLQASIVGLPPALQELFELLRRGDIQLDDVRRGLQEGDFRDDWIEATLGLAYAWASPTDFIRAGVQEQMSMADAETWAGKTGLDITTPLPLDVGSTGIPANMFGLGVAVAGRPPGPQEAARMALRGIIEWTGSGADETTFQQAIAESDVKTKWTDALQKLAEYFPPVGEIGTLLERGAITHDQAVSYWEANGVPTALSTAYAAMAQQQSTIQDKLLARGQIVIGYFDHIFSKQQAEELLGLLGYSGTVADDLLAIADFRRDIQAINGVVRKISTLYTNYKISATNAKAALIDVGIDDPQATAILGYWEAVREQPIRLPSVAEIGGAVKYGTLTQAQGLAELESLGYEPRDAAIVLSAHAEAQVTPLPAAGDTVTG